MVRIAEGTETAERAHLAEGEPEILRAAGGPCWSRASRRRSAYHC